MEGPASQLPRPLLWAPFSFLPVSSSSSLSHRCQFRFWWGGGAPGLQTPPSGGRCSHTVTPHSLVFLGMSLCIVSIVSYLSRACHLEVGDEHHE